MKMKEYILHSNKSKGVAYHLNIFNQFYTSYLGKLQFFLNPAHHNTQKQADCSPNTKI